jgi:S-DNA-T family DNA segregation ATPase FtsK/SpoIIIE
VASRTDSRVVLDEMGADKLLGNGDMLFLWPGTSTLIRGQGTYVSDDEINHVVEFVGTEEPQFVKELVALKPAGMAGDNPQDHWKSRDELYEAAIDCIVREGRGSVSLLQRALGVGYGRGARLIDFMAEDGIVGPYNGSQAREVLITVEQWEEMAGYNKSGGGPSSGASSAGTAVSQPARPARSNKIRPEPEPEPEDDEEVDELDEEEAEEDDADDESDWDDEEDDEADDGPSYRTA